MTDSNIRQIRDAMKRTVYGSVEWQCLNLSLARHYCRSGDFDSAKKCAGKIVESKVPDESRVNYFTLLARLAESDNDLTSAVDCLRKAKSADRALHQPRQQFDLTKQIAITFDSNQLLDEAIDEWQSLNDKINNLEYL